MADRTEEAALARRLSIIVGGEPRVLRTLNLDESDDWLGKIGAAIAGIEIPNGMDAAETFDSLARVPTRAMLGLVMAYDVDHALPPEAELRKLFDQRELYAALRAMVTAEAPFVTDVRSAAAAFGPQVRTAIGILLATVGDRYRPANSTNGHSPIGDSIPALSGAVSRSNSSRSSGATGPSASRENGATTL